MGYVPARQVKYAILGEFMNKIYGIMAMVAVVALLGCLGGGQQAAKNQTNESQPTGESAAPVTVEINIQNNAFSQTEITLKAGDSIKWTNLDDRIHQVQIIGVISSPVLKKSDTWTYKFDAAGTYAFRDAELPYMSGTVTVA